MDLSEKHHTFRWQIESKPDGGFIARADDPADTIEASTKEEVEARIKEKIAAALGPELASKIDFARPGTQITTRIDKKVFPLSQLGQITSAAQLPEAPPPPIDAGGGGSMLSTMWKIAVLVGIAIIIWLLLLQRR